MKKYEVKDPKRLREIAFELIDKAETTQKVLPNSTYVPVEGLQEDYYTYIANVKYIYRGQLPIHKYFEGKYHVIAYKDLNDVIYDQTDVPPLAQMVFRFLDGDESMYEKMQASFVETQAAIDKMVRNDVIKGIRLGSNLKPSVEDELLKIDAYYRKYNQELLNPYYDIFSNIRVKGRQKKKD